MSKLFFDPAIFATLVHLLRGRAEAQPQQRAFTFLHDGEAEEHHLTYAELDRRARAIAAWLQQNAHPGDRVLLLYPPGLEYIAAFFGCLYAGCVAVPAYPPNPARLERTMPRLRAILHNARPSVALANAATAALAPKLGALEPDFQGLRWFASDGPGPQSDEWREREPDGDTLAFLQYTSGSTAAPKGVMLSHANLLHNSATIQRAFGHSPESRGVIWLPPYHDMGLIGGILQPLYAGFPTVLMAPVDFLQRPQRWLEAISRYRATTSGGPNFAYDLCVRRIDAEQRAELDLSSWRVAFNGAEPVRAETLERFASAFAPAGFRRSAFYPCYGLAEATLIVSGGELAAAPAVGSFAAAELERDRASELPSGGPAARTLVGSGHGLSGQQVLVVDRDTAAQCAPGAIGEIWVSGPSVARGYWDQPALTSATFAARLADGRGPFLRTGDLGFVRDGELFVTGRLKDLIIIRGRNHYPQDIELTVERCHPALQPGAGAAFTVETAGEERLVVVHEVTRQARNTPADQLIAAIRQAVAEQHELNTYAVVLLRPGGIPKTSSGKIQRHAARAGYLAGTLPVLGRSVLDAAAADQPARAAITAEELLSIPPAARRERMEAFLREQLARLLGATQIDPEQPISGLGLDSLLAVELQFTLQRDLGLSLPLSALLEDTSLRELAAHAADQLAAGGLAPIECVVGAGEHPLAAGQQALWLMHQLDPSSSAYTIASALRITAPLDVERLAAAFGRLAERHPALRTTFATRDGAPVQLVHQQGGLEVALEDAAGWSEAALQRRLSAETAQPFDLERGPLARVHLFRRGPAEHVLLFCIHHSVADLWSLGVLVRELSALYRRGPDAALPAAPSFADYAHWQRAMLASAASAPLWDYWQRQLAGPLPVLRLPTDRPRPTVQRSRGAAHGFAIEAGLSARLKAVAQAHRTTLFTLLLAAFQVLLHRHSGQDDLIVGAPSTGRERAEWRDLVGYLVNPLPLRADLAGNPTFAALLAQVRQTVIGALEHQALPFGALVERLQPERDPSHAPIFQVMFALQSMPLGDGVDLGALALGAASAPLDLGGLPCVAYPLEQPSAQFDLTLTLAETAGGLSGALQYSTDLFDPATIARLAGHFQTLLAAIAADQAQPIHALPLLTSTEQAEQAGWNQTAAAYPATATLHGLIAAQAARAPDAIAVECAGQRLTYAALNARANQLARHLRAGGVGPEVPVGVCLERSPELVVAVLGILKAGGAYLPLDPTYPAGRLAQMLADAQAPLLITAAGLHELLPEHPGRVICLERDWTAIAAWPDHDLAATATADHLAYVIYTSGSTGRPKGVGCPHHAVVNLLSDIDRRQPLRSGEAASLWTSMSFDVAVYELFSALTVGATLHLVPEALRADGPGVCAWLAERRIASAYLPPFMIADLAAAVERDPAAFHLRRLLVGVEPIPEALLGRIGGRLPELTILNGYGPTETTVCSTIYAVASGSERERPAPIGRPLQNTQIYLLDGRLQPVPIGVAGEVYIGGAGLARGYLNRPELTAERFVPDPFGADGARLYRVGDLARRLPDGNLEFLGRADQQIKLRGFRIELGEIEAALRSHPAVREAVALAREDTPGAKHLVAYVVPWLDPAEHAGPAGERLERELRDAAAAHLPAYMQPAAIVLLAALPLTPSGKIDRQALPRPAAPEQASGDAPASPIEATLAGLWAELLGGAAPGREANFFSLGGHSLLASRLVHRLRETFQVDLGLQTVFEAPTIAAQAERIAAARSADARDSEPLEPIDRSAPLEISFAQQRLWFLDQLEPGSPVYNTPLAVRLSGRLDLDALRASLNQIIVRHEALRTTFATRAGQPVQVIQPPAEIELHLGDLSGFPEDEREERARQELSAAVGYSFDLSRGPLLRAHLLRLGAEDHIFLALTHHIVFDGSHDLFYQELAALYNARLRGDEAALPALPIQYADYASWQRRWLAGPRLEAQLAYWREQLSGDLSPLNLPTDRPRPPLQSFNGARSSFSLPAELAAGLKSLSASAGLTPFMVGLAAFQALLQRYSGQDRIAVGSPVVNRSQPAAQALIGNMVNTLVLRTDLGGNPTFAELLGRVREVALGAYLHQDVPFELLVDAVQPARDFSRNPLFQVMFVFQPAPLQGPALTGLAATALPVDSGTARFDLLLALWDGGAEIAGMLEYNRDLFDESTIERIQAHFTNLLSSAVADPDRRLADLELLAPAERQRMLHEWNATARDYGRERCLHELFEDQAARNPAALAVLAGAGELTYRELNERANQIAHLLRSRGVGRGAMVGVYMERSLELIPALLGVLKAGATYVPLEISYPQARVAWILGALDVRCVLTSGARLADLDAISADVPGLADAVCPDLAAGGATAGGLRVWGQPDLAGQPRSNPPRSGTAADLAYVIFTSGSTGTPKGVMVRHRPAVNLIEWVNRTFGVGRADRVLFVTSICFDLSVYDIFGLLAAGGSIRVAGEAELHDPERLVAILAGEPITFWDSAPALLNQLAPLLPAAPPADHPLRLVFLSGDWIPVALPDQVRRAFPRASVISLGGATEAAIWSNYYPIGRVAPEWTSIPYGRPIQNARYYILDARLQPCPVGVAGDLYIGGECLASGYVNDPALTASKFLPDPFSGDTGALMYRTGDQARFWPDGTIIFLGRLDHQVKIRGFRIELGEIESVLGAHPGLREAVVVAREDTPGDRRLVAYVVPPAGQTAPGAAELRQHLQARLPEYMLPAAFVALEALPITANGKLDRQALPAPDRHRPELAAGYQAPADEVEARLAAIWAAQLGLEAVGVHDNFFDLGGHSLLATRIMFQVREEFQAELPLRDLFENPTVAGLARMLRAADRPAASRIESAPQGEKSLAELLADLEQLDDEAEFSDEELLRLLGI